MKVSLFPLILLFLSASASQGQDSTFIWRTAKGPDVYNENNRLLKDPFTGGFYYPRFAGLDVNRDGLSDIISTDYVQVHNKVFVAQKVGGKITYKYDAQYEDAVPTLRDWVITYDFDHDGRRDLFTYAESGGAMTIHRNISQNGRLAFELVTKEQMYRDQGKEYFLRVVTNDVPVIEDIDGDGDVDVLTFDQGGGNVTFYKNHSVELHGHPDTLDFRIATQCWGRFTEEDQTHRIRLAPRCIFEGNKRSSKKKHQGSNMLAIDYDNDGDMDMLLSDVDYEHVTLLENGWNPETSNGHYRDTIIASYTEYPSKSPFDVRFFPSLSYLDLDDDGVRDLILAPSGTKGAFDVVNCWFYKNHGKETSPDFRLADEGFLQEEMLDLGEFSNPKLFDYDADGDLDLFVGAPLPKVHDSSEEIHRLVLFENTGTSKKPVFRLKDNDYLNLSQLKLFDFSHGFGDANNDGTIDLFFGTIWGKVMLFPNKNGSDKPADFGPRIKAYDSMDVIGQANPCVYDVNGDGKNDFLIGDEQGSIFYFEWYQDSLVLRDSFFGDIRLRRDTFGGNATPVMADFDGDGRPELMVGTASGQVFFYDDVDYKQQVFEHVPVMYNELIGWFGSANVGANTHLCTGDLNGDGHHELLVGGRTGGLLYFAPDFIRNVAAEPIPDAFQNTWLYPNPSKGLLRIETDILQGDAGLLKLYALDGREVAQFTIAHGVTLQIEHLNAGTYLAVMTLHSGKAITQKVVLE